MKKTMKLMTALFAMILLCTCLPLGSVSAATWDQIRYEATGDEVTITKCSKEAGKVIIPVAIDGYAVTTIANSAFSYCHDLTAVILPDSVTTIGEWAFSETASLKSVTIGAGVTTIGDYAFSGCYSLTDVYYMGSRADRDAIQIGSGNGALDTATWHYYDATKQATSGTTGDCTWTLDENGHLTISGKGAMADYGFKADSGFNSTAAPWGWRVKSVTIEDGVTAIGERAFFFCAFLESATIGDSVTTIGKFAFDSCYSLTSITIGNGVKTIVYGAFNECRNLASVTIPDSVTTIGEWAFFACESLVSVTLGAGVATIEENAFESCDYLSKVDYTGDEDARDAIRIEKGNHKLEYAGWNYHPIVEQPSVDQDTEDKDRVDQDQDVEDNDDSRDSVADSDAEEYDEDENRNADEGGIAPWLWIVIAAGAVVVIAAVVVPVLLKKKSV